MDGQRNDKYVFLFEKLLNVMTSSGECDREKLREAIGELCEFFHVAKGTAEFYRSLSHEKMGQGLFYCEYDNGKADKILMKKRFETNTSAVLIGTLYVAKEEPLLSEDEMEKLDVILRVLLSYLRRTRLQNAIERLGYHDEIGYPNLRSFFRFLDKTAENGELSGHTAIYFNLRHFSLINREIGRENGDKAMHSYIEKIKSIIGEEGIVSRLGGDNFLAAFRNEVLDPVLEAMKGVPITYDEEKEKRIVVSACAGVFCMPEGFRMVNSGEIMDRLIPACNAAKNDNKGTIVFYSDAMAMLKNRQMGLQRDFPQAMEKKEFKVYYQPKVDVETGEIIGAEALCRWVKNGQIIPPAEFIPVLEQNTDICQLDFYMLDMVCKDLNRWLDEGKKVVRISVNFSRKHLLDPDLQEHVLKIINENHVPHEFLEIELTETTTDLEFRDLKRIVAGLRKEGIRTSVDDFGMGYSSLNLIREIPWDVLKIDKSFLPADDEQQGSVTSLMYRHVVEMTRDLGMECITEGVETARQVELLRSNGCRFAQGFHFDKPLPVVEFEKRLDQRFYSER